MAAVLEWLPDPVKKLFGVCLSTIRSARVTGKSMAKKIANHHQPQKQGMKRDFEREVAHRKQQHNSEMVAYLSLKRMLQSLLRRGQQQLRDGCSSPLAASSPSVFLGGCFFSHA